jgi:pimeloyl-ACP methyl ester carboxylesterase
VQLATVQDLANYWASEYDWRRCEAKLNALPQFTTEIDGLDVHFIHVRSPQQDALPLIVSHGWPGSVIEQLKIIEPLTNPAEHGVIASDAFDVVIPSIPGYGFSGKPAAGWGPDRIARAWAVLMERLGYRRYVAQGGDWGTAISAAMARQAPQGLLGIHVSFAQMVPLVMLGHIRNGEPAPADLSDAEKRAYGQVAFATYHRGYGVIQGTRPQTIGYSLADTPVGLAAWLLDHDTGTYEHLAQLFAGQPYGAITRDDWLDNTSLYWLTNTATSAARLYWQQAVTGKNFYAAADVSLPAAVTVFPQEYVQAPRSWTEQAYYNLIYFNEAEKGGHFAAWEQPQLFSEELRAAFRTLR